MSLETASFINQLVATNPAHADLLNQSDGHIKLIKAVLQSQFPNFTAAALNSTNAQIDTCVTALNQGGNTAALIPIGGTIMWWSNTLPNSDSVHWAWCNGATIGTTSSFAALAAACPVLVSGSNVVAPNLCEVVPMGRQGMGGASSRSLISATTTPNQGNAGTLGLTTVIGETSHTIAAGELPAHSHTASSSSSQSFGFTSTSTITDTHTHGYTVVSGASAGYQTGSGIAGWTSSAATSTTGTNAGSITCSTSTSITSGSITTSTTVNNSSAPTTTTNVFQPTMPVNWIIRIA